MAVELFGRRDDEFMAMFTGMWLVTSKRLEGTMSVHKLPALTFASKHQVAVSLLDTPFGLPCAAAGAMSALQSKRDGMQRRLEGLSKCKTEFQELAKCL